MSGKRQRRKGRFGKLPKRATAKSRGYPRYVVVDGVVHYINYGKVVAVYDKLVVIRFKGKPSRNLETSLPITGFRKVKRGKKGGGVSALR